MKEYMLSFKSRLLKVKTRDEFTVDCIKKKKKDLFEFIIILPQKPL
jgi:hypothetical protein